VYYEDVTLKAGDTVYELVKSYGHPGTDWSTIWNNNKNKPLREKRGQPRSLQVGDVLHIPIDWKILNTTMVFVRANTRVKFEATRSGRKGTNIRWVQTVDRHNQPFGQAPYGQPRYVVDPSSPPDDNEPFYYTAAELTADPNRRTTFSDTPGRAAPVPPLGTTKWRAMLSVAVVTDKRVTILDTHFWGFDIDNAGTVSKVPGRKAAVGEVQDHLRLLQNGFGLGPTNAAGTKADFKDMGWTFRMPPAP